MNANETQDFFGHYFFNKSLGDIPTQLSHYSKEELEARLSIYKNNIYFSLIEVLKDTFKSIVETIGEELFVNVARAYLANKPDSNAAIIEFGKDFPDFLKSVDNLSQLTYLYDLANLDYQHHLCYYAIDAEPMPAEAFAQFDTEELIASSVKFVPSVKVMSSQYPIYSIWDLAQDPEKDIKIDANNAEYLLLYRADMETVLLNIDYSLYLFLTYLEQQHTLEEALSLVIDENENFNATQTIGFLVQSGIVKELFTRP